MTARITFVLLGLLAVGSALPPAGAAERREKRENRDGRRPMRDEAFKIVDAYLLSNMQESLGLTDEQFAKALPLAKRLQQDRRDFAERRFRLHRELRELLASGNATESAVVEQLKALRDVEAEEPKVMRKNREALDDILTPLQQAKYRILEGDVERKIRELMRPGRFPGGPGGPPPVEK